MTGWYYGPYAHGCAPDASNTQVAGGVPGDGPAPREAWGYQSCTETLHHFSTPSDAWRHYTFDLQAISALCASYYGVRPQPHRLERWSGGWKIADERLTSNLICPTAGVTRGMEAASCALRTRCPAAPSL